MNNHWHDLIQQYISGTISDDDAAALEQQLISDSNLRDGYLDALNLDSALAATAESAELALSLPVLPSQRALTPALPSHWLSWRPLTAAAAGLVIGLFSASVVWAVAKPARSTQVRPVLSEGFEDAGMSFERGFPRSAGVWGGDKVQVVRSDSAEEGQQVLRFGPAAKRKFGYADSVVDISALADDVAGGRHELRLRASVRTVGGQAPEQLYTLRLAAFAEDAAAVRELWFSGGETSQRALGFAARRLDAAQDGWVALEATLPLPVGARHLVVSIGAAPVDESTQAGSYELDALRLDLVTTPEVLP